VEAPSEPIDDQSVERYEMLRDHALDGAESGWRLGLALLQRSGMAAWARASQSIDTRAPLRPTRAAAQPDADGDAIVAVLTAMALACVGDR
jgi:hypothetical protein